MPNHNKPHNFTDLTGQLFGDWLVISDAERQHGKTAWLCQCRCGAERVIRGQSLSRGVSTSCGCSRGASYTMQGHTSQGAISPEYSSWIGMRMRCNNPNTTHYARYGGRGISVCDRWNSSFASFLADMGPMPTKKHTIDRKDNDDNYEPSNCRWATRKEQGQNRHWAAPKIPRGRDSRGRFA